MTDREAHNSSDDSDDDFMPISARSTGFTWAPPLPVPASLDLMGLPRHIGPWRSLEDDEIVIRARATRNPTGCVDLRIASVMVTENRRR